MKMKNKLKKYARRTMALLCALATMLPLLTFSAAGVDSGDVTASAVNGQVAIFKWTAIHDPAEIPEGTSYIMALTELNTVWRGSSGENNFYKGYGFGYNTSSDRSAVYNRTYSTRGHKGDVFYTVGSQNALVIRRDIEYGWNEYEGVDKADRYWDEYNLGPNVPIWTTEDRKVGNDTITTLTMVRWNDSSYLLDDTIGSANWFRGLLNGNPGASDKDKAYWKEQVGLYAPEITNLAQKLANGENPMAGKYVGSRYCIGLNYSQKAGSREGNFNFTYAVYGNNPSLCIAKWDDQHKGKIWGEPEGTWGGRAWFNLWLGKPIMYSMMTGDYPVHSGQTLNMNAEEGFNGVYIPRDVTLTVEKGGTVSINEPVFNDGTIVVDGGTLIIQDGGRLSNLATDGKNEIIVKNGGDVIIMPGGALYTNADYAMTLKNSRLINFGTFLLGGNLMLYSSFVENRKGGVIAGSLRFGDYSIDKFYQTVWDDSQDKYVKDQSKYCEIDNQTGNMIYKTGNWNYGNYTYEEMVSEADYRSKYLICDKNQIQLKPDWTPNFAGFDKASDTNLTNLRNSGTVPNSMVNYGSSKIYIYDTQEHFDKYGCISEDAGSKMLFGIGNNIAFVAKTKGQLEQLLLSVNENS